ncbi:uncharacterized protein EHS24_001797 [Apiotrichum porosum]|uniref:Uncharacterized protein n=1 Tax=Apiotrichum porosum TaxID=105984 RepID=A0A427XJ47_9TREE|nr:uncharacterized protein EHS24_001797 [Apiotrichum porosum]RSH78876.1 hypothetical protein EHS24_001797 [Apiotrichum porosum]
MSLLRSVSTISVSDFAALVDAAPLSTCPRSASPELRGAPLRRMSKAPSNPILRTNTPPLARKRSVSNLGAYEDDDNSDCDNEYCDADDRYPGHVCLERCTGSPTPRSHASGSATPSLSYASSDDDDESVQDEDEPGDDEDDGIIWFGRREPPSPERVTLFYAWVGHSLTQETTRSALLTQRTHHLWTRLALLWRLRRHRSMKSGPSIGPSFGAAAATTARVK